MTRRYNEAGKRRMEQIAQMCIGQLPDGTLVRGVVPKSVCIVCETPRLDDGTRCRLCGSLPPAVIRSMQAAKERMLSRPAMPWGDVL